MAEIVLCCGKVCSGKTTFAAELKRTHGYFHFSSDVWMLHFYPPTEERALFDERLAKCEEMIYRVSEEILASGRNVVIDAGFWKRSERETLHSRFAALGHQVSLVYFPITLEQQLSYMRARNVADTPGTYHFDHETVVTLNSFFEDPADEPVLSKDEYVDRLKTV